MNKLIPLLAGLLFGVGLAMSGMTDTAKVLGFLDLFGNWDPTLAFVMGGAVATTLIGFRLVLRQSKPVCESEFQLPKNNKLDKPLLIGAAIFGIGWGVYGYCPGPGLAALVYLDGKTLVFVVALLIGMLLAHQTSQKEWIK
ncbi:MAG TPA: YeeE/YedE family protein [Cellvibrionaceae bacterium]